MTNKDYKVVMAYLNNLKKDAIDEGELKKPLVVAGFIQHLENIFYLLSQTDQKVDKEYLTAKEYSEQYGVHPYTAKRLAAKGKIPAVKVGGQWRFIVPKGEKDA